MCQAGEWGKCVGKLDLRLRLSGEHRYKVMSYSSELVRVDSRTEPARDVERIVWRAAKPYYREVGKLDRAVPKSQAAAWVAECLREAAGVQVGVEPRGGVENGLRAGVVSHIDIRRMFPSASQVVTLTVTAQQLREYVVSADAALAGANLKDGALYVEGIELEDAQALTLAIERRYARTSPVLAGAQFRELGTSVRDMIAEHVAGAFESK